jgi:hypothetical protein
MRNTQERSCYSDVGNQNHPLLPTLISVTEPAAFPAKVEDNSSRSLRLFGRNVQLLRCGGPCVKEDVIEMAFNAGAVAL